MEQVTLDQLDEQLGEMESALMDVEEDARILTTLISDEDIRSRLSDIESKARRLQFLVGRLYMPLADLDTDTLRDELESRGCRIALVP